MMPFEDEDPEELMASGVMPNTPRDPEKEALRMQKMKAFLQPRMRPDRSAEQPLRDSNSDLALINLFGQAANQAGTIGGKAASSAPLDQLTQRAMQGNQQQMAQMEQDRQQVGQDEDRQLKMLQYFGKSDDAARAAKATEDYRNKTLKQKDTELEIRKGEAAAKQDKSSGTNEGLKALDRDYAKDYNDWTSTGRSGYEKNLKLLSDAKAELEASKGNFGTSGNIVGRMPDALRSENSRVIQQKVQSAAQGAMKAALGSAFTEKEGTRIMNLSYDPTLSPERNMAKIDEAIADIKAKAEDQEGKSRYFEKNQTLKDYKAPERGTGPKPGDVMDGYVFKGGDPSDAASWEKQ